MFPGIGTVINICSIIVGSLLGVLIGKKLGDKLRTLITDVLGCITAISAADALAAYWSKDLQSSMPDGWPILVIVFSLLGGAIIGNWMRLEDRLENLGIKLRDKFAKNNSSNFVEGFVSASLIFVIGPLAILGSISVAFAASLGWGVALSSLPVGVVQFFWTGVGLFLGTVLADYQIAAMTAVGGVLLIGISLRLLKIREIAVANLLPALALAPLLSLVVNKYI